MIRERQNIVCISTIDWDFVWQGHQEIMSTLARQGHRVLFIENTGVRSATLKDVSRLRHRLLNWRKGIKGIRKVLDNVYVYAPLVLPFPYSRVARAINKALMAWTIRSWTKTMRFNNPVIWTWLPTALALELIHLLDGQLVVYYCCDDFQASSSGSKRIRETEDILLRQADLVFAHSKSLYDRCRQFTDHVHIFQYGFNQQVFVHANDRPPVDLAKLKRPILGYVGGVHKVVDFDLVEKVALAHPDKSVVFVGPLQTDVGQLASMSNVHFLGQKRYEELPTYIKHFDLGLIPYVLNDYTKSVYPTKLNEYLIMGKPVISTRLPEVEYFNQCHGRIVAVADDQDTFVRLISEELAGDSELLRTQRIREVERNAWDQKIEAMKKLIQAKLDEKVKLREQNWQYALERFYRSTRRKVAAAFAACFMLYLLFFYTPVIRSLGEPLRIMDKPDRADVIMVLAGGVGESGEPGEAYQEKVKQGVELYHQGLADHLVFSSGITYVFKEAQVMKALAIALGVPERAIILDERGGGNYGSLLTVKRIMDEHGWTRMLLVTSRYNATRSRLVAQKHLAGISVAITPAPQSTFFGESGPLSWAQARAIFHEYEAIAYYWLKGYI
jgi:uncharacterized SAM-binding protein YcdF (DUF218 family)/glycosyltransferase involved in cell wall biosynthesis